MTKHILGQAIWQCVVLFVFLFAGEYLIPESEPGLIYEPTGNTFPGRADDWEGNPLWTKEMYTEHGASRHLTFIFSAFVMMQIFNMLCCRKIHDEWNFFEGLHANFIFIGVWLVIVGGQILITQFGGAVFVVSKYGLDGTQWGLAIAIGTSSILVNAILKALPDWMSPKIGQDSVDDRRKAEGRNK